MNLLKNRRTLDDIIRFTSSVGEKSIFTGNLSTADNVVIRGTVIGNSDVEGIIVIKSKGKWIGDMSAYSIVIDGQVEGNITAINKIEIQKNANIVGNLTSPKIAIERGARHEGQIHMDDKTNITTFEEKRKE
ncbi:MAG: polymer-forming cytoskeletal protein [Thiohalomonadales bacterium]